MRPTIAAYDELPYESYAVEWTSPERLVLASAYRGGPRPPSRGYRYLELGCGRGTNLRALAFYRPEGEFVGLDGSAKHIEFARASVRELGLSRLRFIHADFDRADDDLDGEFDFIVAHGVFSWVPRDTATRLLGLMRRRLRPGGLCYVGYNTRPGWNVRGLVREHLLGQTSDIGGIRAKAERAQEVAARFASALEGTQTPYAQLMAKEFNLVVEMGLSYVAHEYLAEHNHPYWRSEFAALAAEQGLHVVGDADFYAASGRLPPGLEAWLEQETLGGPAPADTVDLLCYRQHHCPVLAAAVGPPRPLAAAELADMFVASRLLPTPDEAVLGDGLDFVVPGTERRITVYKPAVESMLRAIGPDFPRGRRLGDLVADVAEIEDDVRLLVGQGLLDLRGWEPADPGLGPSPNALQELEATEGPYVTCGYHRRHAVELVD